MLNKAFGCLLLISSLCSPSLVFSDDLALSDNLPLHNNNPHASCSVPVNTEQGPVRGFNSKKSNANEVCAYLGIPFAKPPIEALRWQAPQSPEPRTSTLHANAYGPDCMQSRWLSDATIKTAATETSEDCLYLNIWRPKKPGNYPVMVWIHGGALILGSSAWPIYDGTNLAGNKDVILVSINYRLGAFGYLAHPALENKDDGFKGGSTGNYGLLDQLEALKWVKANIHNFHGDPDNITLFGESAGGWSVFTLLSMPASEALFHKAIVQSGGSKTAHPHQQAFDIGERFAKALGCHKYDDIAHCLRTAPAKTINRKSLRANARCMASFKIDTGFCFIPRIDGTLLPDLPLTLIQQAQYPKRPVMVGYTSKDPWFLKNASIESAKAMQGSNPTWLYQFKFKKHALNLFTSGVHGTELPFVFDTLTDFKVFHNKYRFYKEKHAQKAQQLVSDMQSYWSNFAKYGNPNGSGENNKLLEWPEYSNKRYIFLSNKTEIRSEK